MDDFMKKIGFFAGLVAAVGGAGGFTELPTTATFVDYVMIATLITGGCVMMYFCGKED